MSNPTPTQPHDETEPPVRPVTPQAATQRAEVIVDRMGERVGYFASSMAQRIRVATAHAREEAEDIWVEAQSMRRKKNP